MRDFERNAIGLPNEMKARPSMASDRFKTNETCYEISRRRMASAVAWVLLEALSFFVADLI
ncbi:hypothetical protein DLJ82_6280 (plasmid) [Rhizobium leguminosarum]|uniref:Uncharacterized protein n=1 Tax=Rhizobium leguminosarum TaxID=384 RepID=A0A2Z4YSI5_RHILE|nr:hypothetical protein DLJ82_6280 [Rhizobium leguminosarum]